MCYRGNTERGAHNQHQPRKRPRHEGKKHGLVLQDSRCGMSALAGSPSFNLSDYVDTGSQQSSQLNTSGTRSTDSAAVDLAAQLQATQTETHSAREDVTDTDLMASSTCHLGHERELLMNLEIQATKVLFRKYYIDILFLKRLVYVFLIFAIMDTRNYELLGTVF